MDANILKEYLEQRKELAANIFRGIMKSMGTKLEDIPDEFATELGDSVFNASNEIASTMLSIMAESEGNFEYDQEQ